jgi:two-component system NtrC family sensor kinase
MSTPTPHAPPIALSEFFDGHPVATFTIDNAHVITHWNRACEHLLGWSKAEMVGTRRHALAFYARERPMLSDLIVDGDGAALARHLASPIIPGAYEAEDYFPNLGERGHWLHFSAAPLRDESGTIVGAIETMRDVTERRVAENALRRAHDNLEHLVEQRTIQLGDANERLEQDISQRQQAEAELRQRNIELTELNARLSMAQEQLVQSEKLASIGQLAAGVAHEINNPIGYINSNFATLQSYVGQLFEMLRAYEEAEGAIAAAEVLSRISELRHAIDLGYLRTDIPQLMAESREGLERVRRIVQDLKDFSHADAQREWQWFNLHHGMDSTLNIVANEIRYSADVVKEYGDIPDIECLSSQINQVVMNLVVNAAHAIRPGRGQITLRTGTEGDHVWFSVSDTGSGIAPEHLDRIFDPFFTTKPIGKGTGLGLSVTYGIVQTHCGRIEVDSAPGKGTTFRVVLPIHHPVHPADREATPG